MEDKGLIERKPNPEDGRGVLIHLTPLEKKKRDYSRERVLTLMMPLETIFLMKKLKIFMKSLSLLII